MKILPFILLALTSVLPAIAAPTRILEGQRDIPVVAEADILVVGGSVAGVAAAVAAAEQGRSVYLATPKMYLGEDLCATYQLWLEPGEEPVSELGMAMFDTTKKEQSAPFTYKPDRPSQGKHLDCSPPGMLTDGLWKSVFNQSVEYGGDVSIVADLGEAKPLRELRAMVYQATNNFDVRDMACDKSLDGKTWEEVGIVKNEELGKGSYLMKSLCLALPAEGDARFIRFKIRKGEKAKRMLLGELLILTKEKKKELPKDSRQNTTPMAIKRNLEEALIKAGVKFVYGSFATDVLLNEKNETAGAVIANRAGRQAIRAGLIIDATDKAWFAKLAGATPLPLPQTTLFQRVVVGGEPRKGGGIVSCRQVPMKNTIGGVNAASYGSGGFGNTVKSVNKAMVVPHTHVLLYTLDIPIKNLDYSEFARAEQLARDWTFDPRQVEESERLRPLFPVGVEVDGFLARGCKKLLVAPHGNPLAMLKEGKALGRLAATLSEKREKSASYRIGTAATVAKTGEIGETLEGLRPVSAIEEKISSGPRDLPVLGEYDVVVVGGGTSGAPAAIGAARGGAKTLVVEYLDGLGGTGTVGLIGIYCAGYRKGFTQEIDAGIKKLKASTYVVGKQEYWRREIRKAKGEIWFGAIGCGAYRQENRVAGVVVATPQGRGVVLCKAVIDGTGNAEIAASAGAKIAYNSATDAAMQGTGIPYRAPGASYINTDWTYVDERDVVDVTTALVAAKRRFADAYDLAQLIDARERRRIVGDYTLNPLDIINQRRFPDTIQISQGGKLDKHGATVHRYYNINNHFGGLSYTPYRCLLPQGLDGILVVGLGISAHRDAIPSIRMQPCLQNLGYAAGTAASMVAKSGSTTRDIDIKALQEHLVKKGCLTPEVPTHQDSYPFPNIIVQGAVTQLAGKDYKKLGIIMASPETAIPLMQNAYATEKTPEGKLRLAHVLGMMGDATGIETLVAKIKEETTFTEENISTYFPNISWFDSYILAAGYSGDKRALAPILAKLEFLSKDPSLSWKHYKVIALALEALGDPAGAKPLAEVLQRRKLTEEGISDSIHDKRTRGKGGSLALTLARVTYNLGDWEGVGEKALRSFSNDERSHYRLHVIQVLSSPAGSALR